MSKSRRHDAGRVQAAGTIPWRVRQGRLEVLLVHRAKYDDWSWPKGKLDDGESHAAAAVRETYEETGLHVRLGIPLPPANYQVAAKGGGKDIRPGPDGDEQARLDKHVAYWAAEVVGGDGNLAHEVDDTAWMPVKAAEKALTQDNDKRQLRGLVRAYRQDRLDTRPVIIVRHAIAKRRKDWPGEDLARPLDARGKKQAQRLVELLSPYAPVRIETSPAVRCADTVAPLAEALGVELVTRVPLSEEGFEANPAKAPAVMRRVVKARKPSIVCSHRPVLPSLLGILPAVADRTQDAERLRRRAEKGMAKGEAIVCHISRAGHPRIVAIERIMP